MYDGYYPLYKVKIYVSNLWLYDQILHSRQWGAIAQKDQVSRSGLRESWVLEILGSRQIFEVVMGSKIVESGETVFELDLFSTKVCWNLAPRTSIPLEDGISIVITLQPSQCPFYQIKYFLTTLISV